MRRYTQIHPLRWMRADTHTDTAITLGCAQIHPDTPTRLDARRYARRYAHYARMRADTPRHAHYAGCAQLRTQIRSLCQDARRYTQIRPLRWMRADTHADTPITLGCAQIHPDTPTTLDARRSNERLWLAAAQEPLASWAVGPNLFAGR